MSGSAKTSSSLSESSGSGPSSSDSSGSGGPPGEPCGTCGWERGPFGQWTEWVLLFNSCDAGCACEEPDWEPDPPGPTTASSDCYAV